MINFIIISYCTPGAYEAEAQRLINSLVRLTLPHDVRVLTDQGSWQRNCLVKPLFIKEMLRQYNKPCLFVDADAILHDSPELINTLIQEKIDFAVHYFRKTQLASGTLFFNNTPAAINILDLWSERNHTHPNDHDQQNLQEIIDHGRIPDNFKIFYLPEEYCSIFDLSNIQQPVIEHFQASRRLRSGINIAALEKAKYTKQWKGEYMPSRSSFFLSRYIPSFAPVGNKLLDIGCGDGHNVKELREIGYDCTGLDITLAGVKWDKTGFIEAPIWCMPFPDETFDTTFSSDVLEHLPEDMVPIAIKEIFRVTKTRTFHCIATFPHVVDGTTLHLTVMPISFWHEQFARLNTKRTQFDLIDRAVFLNKMEACAR